MNKVIGNQNNVSEKAGRRLYEQAVKTRSKQLEKQRKNPHECTFQPTLNTRNVTLMKKSATPEGTNRFDRLYENAQKGVIKRHDLRTTSLPEYSFKPQIINYYKGQGRQGRHNNDNQGNEDNTPRYDTLYNSAKTARQKQELKQSIRKQKEIDDCTFSPQINKKKGAKTSLKSKLYDVTYTQKRQEERERQKMERELKECSFKPIITKAEVSSSSSSSVVVSSKTTIPIHDRLTQEGKKRQEKIQQKRQLQEMELRSKLSFRPTISKSLSTKEMVTTESSSSSCIYDRLYNANMRKQVIAKREKQKREQDMKSCSFKVGKNIEY